jgi:NADPH:quinone reductase-like Zn-dependent oxidoreductase
MEGLSLTADIPRLLRQRITIRGVLVGSRRSFERMNDALEIMRIHPVIDKIYPFSETVAAFERLNRGPFGKVVIDARA